MSRVFWAACTAVLLLAVAGCDDERRAVGADDLGEAPLPTIDVEIDEEGFDPDELVVSAGDAIEFRNVGDEEHGVRSGDVVDSGLLLPGETTVVVLDTPQRLEVEDIGDPDHVMTIEVQPEVD